MINENNITMKGTENQIKFANDLLNEFNARTQKFESVGKGEKIDANLRNEFVSLINEETNAAKVIDFCKNFGHVVEGVKRGHSIQEQLNS